MKVTKSRSFYHDKVLPPQKVVMPYDKSHVILSIIMFARILSYNIFLPIIKAFLSAMFALEDFMEVIILIVIK